MRPFHQPHRVAASVVSLCLSPGLLTGCFGATSYSYQNVTVALSPQITSLPVNGSVTFTTTTSNAPNYPIFYVLPTTPTSTYGTVTSNTNNGTGVYIAPSTPPIYTAAQVASGYVQGQAGIIAYVPNSTTNVLSDASATEFFTITAPSVTAGVSPATVSVARGATQQFTGYAVGNVNGAITYQVNGVAGGNSTVGTITAAGLYTAPATIPMSGATVIITLTSMADPTKTATATVTVT